MNTTKYFIKFINDDHEIVDAFTIEAATILAQAEQIKKGHDYTIEFIKNYETGFIIWP